MAINFNQRWNIVESLNASTSVALPSLKINVGSIGGDLAGNYQHTVTAGGVQLYTGTANRSYRVSSYRKTSTWVNISSGAYDVYGSTVDAANLNTFLTNMTTGDLLVLTTSDEPANNKSYFEINLKNNFGAKLITNAFEFRSMYILIAVKGRLSPIYERYERRYSEGISATLWLV